MKVTNTELNVLRVMAEKETDWTWIMLDRTLAIRGIAGFSNVANIVASLVNNGMVEAVYIENASKPRYRVSEQGHQLLRENNDN
ncbi:MarR family transcriptional regulator [Cronobacter sakazakii]|nr:MarR family transcriptional regulator [Cronobacter sakazakii]ELY4392180.1 MarR family transcriptional regulator [Cronobacter sakazakii]